MPATKGQFTPRKIFFGHENFLGLEPILVVRGSSQKKVVCPRKIFLSANQP